MSPKIIRTVLEEGVSTWVPYGISVDVSEWVEELRLQCEQLFADYKANHAHPVSAVTQSLLIIKATPDKK